jgi:hypothetical protein
LVGAFAASIVLAVISAACAVGSLWPRLRARHTPPSLIYFDHIARRYDRAESYVDDLHAALATTGALTSEVGAQIWANSRITRRKFWWGQASLASLLASIAVLAAALVVDVVRPIG